MVRPMRSRGSLKYQKPPLDLEELADRLIERGLEVPERDRAIRYLRHIGYYRLSPYAIPFQEIDTNHQFKRGASFNSLLDMYVFDRSLRLLIIDALERVEVAVRASLTDHMASKYSNPHWYMDGSKFRNQADHTRMLQMVRNTCEERLRSRPDAGEDALVHRSALEHYLTTYGDPELPPSWLMVETLTIGQLSKTLRNLKNRSDLTAVARSIGLTAPVLQSWMHTYVRVRNICAHHGRLWNVGLGVYPAIPSSRSIRWLEGNDALPYWSIQRLYPVLVSLQSVLYTVSPKSRWAQRLHALLEKRPEWNLRGMGLPEGWSENKFWNQILV